MQSLNDKENAAIEFIKNIAKTTDVELYAGNSGGKDSAVLDKLLQMSGIDYHSFYTNTTIDPPGTIAHIRKHYPHTEILQPKESFYQLVERKGLPTRLNRYCCQYLKEYASVGKTVFEGVRSAESRNRAGRDYINIDTRKWQMGATHIYPIYDWSDDDVWNFIKKYDIKLPPHYQHSDRLGCVGCPLVSRKGHREKEFALYPRFYSAIKSAIEMGMRNNPQWKLTNATDRDAEMAMQWWLSGKTMSEFFNQYDFEKTDNGWVKWLKR